MPPPSASAPQSAPAAPANLSSVLPSELMDRSVGGSVWVITKTDREFVGTLTGFDIYVNMVLEDVTELYVAALHSHSQSQTHCIHDVCGRRSMCLIGLCVNA